MPAISSCARSAGRARRALKGARVLVVGAGGLGAPVLLYLAAAGVGTLGVVDDDAVSLSNLQRQVIHGTPEIGTPKVESAARRHRPAQSARDGRSACDAARRRQRARSHRPLRSGVGRLGQFRHALSGVGRLLPRQEAAGHRGARHLRRHAHHHPRARERAATARRIRPTAACFPSRRRPAPCRPARRPASSARSRACSAP